MTLSIKHGLRKSNPRPLPKSTKKALSDFSRRGVSLAVAALLIFSGLSSSPAQAATRDITWISNGSIPISSGSQILAMKFGNNVFMAIASNGDVFTSSNGATWSSAGVLGGPTKPNAAYKADLAFGLAGTPVAGDEGVVGTPTWVFTSKDNGTIWTSKDNGATWSVTATGLNNIKKVAYGDGHFLVGGQGFFKTSTNGINWKDAGNSAISGDGEGRAAFGNNTFVIPITYTNQVCRRSTLSWVDNSTMDCSATFTGLFNAGGADTYFGGIAFGNGVFVGGLNSGSTNNFWTSTDTGATWVRNTSFTSAPRSVAFGGGVFVMERADNSIAISADGLSWRFTLPRPNGGSGLMAYGNGMFIGLGGSGNAYVTAGLLSQVEPSMPTGLVGEAGNGLVNLSWNASADDGGALVTYKVTSNPGSGTCFTTSLNCQISGLTNGTSYVFSVFAVNRVGASSTFQDFTTHTPALPVASVATGSTSQSQVASIPAGITTAEIPASAALPKVSLNFSTTSGIASATVVPTVNPAAASATPFMVSGTTKIVDIQVSGISGPVTVCLDGAASDNLFHFTGGAWVALPDRTYVNGQVCGVTTNFSPFAAAEPRALTPVASSGPTGPRLTIASRVAVTTNGQSLALKGVQLSEILSIKLDGKDVTVIRQTDGELVIQVPAGAEGFPDLQMTHAGGTLTYYKMIQVIKPYQLTRSIKITKFVGSRPTLAGLSALYKVYRVDTSVNVLTCVITVASDASGEDISNAEFLGKSTCQRVVNYSRDIKSAQTLLKKDGAVGSKPVVEITFHRTLSAVRG
jgi:hypothetical protein